MIWGLNREQLFQKRQNQLKKMCKVHRKFAYFPVRLHDGRILWLQYYFYVPSVCIDDKDGTLSIINVLNLFSKSYATSQEAYSSSDYKYIKDNGLAKF